MTKAPELHRLSPQLAVWHAYDPSVKTELFSTALVRNERLLLVDPIPLADDAVAQLMGTALPAGIVVTNANHLRASEDLAAQFQIPVLSDPASFPGQKPARFAPISELSSLAPDFSVLNIEGGVEGEIALHCPDDTLILGDALINAEPYGFTFLPAKYCSNHKAMQKSLRQLLDLKVEKILFAHGIPITANAQTRLASLFSEHV